MNVGLGWIGWILWVLEWLTLLRPTGLSHMATM